MAYYGHTQGNLLIEPYKFEEILKFKIVCEVNEHQKLYLKGIVSEEYKNSNKYIEMADENTDIKISVKDQDDHIVNLFYGMINKISLQSINNVKTLEIEALGNTCLMDIKKKSKSFQGNRMTYREVFESIKSSYNKASMIDNISKNKKNNNIIVQYNETDWEFLKRIASHFNAVIIPECRMDGIKYTIGKGQNGSLYNLKEFNYSMTKGINEFKLKSAQGISKIDDMNFITYEITTNKILDLYQNIQFKNRTLNVYRCEMEFINGILTNTYILRDEKAIKIPRIYNEKLTGLSLEGKVVSVKRDVVKIALGIDSYSNTAKSNTEWLPYSTVFSSSDGTGWYCMPEIGDAIRMYFPDNNEENVYVISSVNLESRDPSKRNNPDIKSISTKYGKQIVMRPGEIDIFSGGNSMILSDDNGILISSDKNITMKGSKIKINGKEVIITGKNGVKLTQNEASVDINHDITMSGFKVNTQ